MSEGSSSVVTLAWVRGVLLLVVLLNHRQGTVAAVLDPSDQDVADALVQWGSWVGCCKKPNCRAMMTPL